MDTYRAHAVMKELKLSRVQAHLEACTMKEAFGVMLLVTLCNSHRVECKNSVCIGQTIDSLRRAMMALSKLNHDVWEEVKEICSEHHDLLRKNHDPATCGTAGLHRLESTGAGFLSISNCCCPSVCILDLPNTDHMIQLVLYGSYCRVFHHNAQFLLVCQQLIKDADEPDPGVGGFGVDHKSPVLKLECCHFLLAVVQIVLAQRSSCAPQIVVVNAMPRMCCDL